MKIVPVGLQCTVPGALKRAGMRDCSYPFDWLWMPGKTSYEILAKLLNEGVESAVDYMTTGWTYCDYDGKERYTRTDRTTECQMNMVTGLGVTHFTIDEDFKSKLRRRFARLLTALHSDEDLLFVYADATSPALNYHLDGVEHGLDATEWLLKIHDLVSPLHPNTKMLYFCWLERARPDDARLRYVPFAPKAHIMEVDELIMRYFLAMPTFFP